MAAQKSSPKPGKKGSKLASLKSAIFGAAKRKAASSASARPAAASTAPKAQPHPSPKKTDKAEMKDKKAHHAAPSSAMPVKGAPSKKGALSNGHHAPASAGKNGAGPAKAAAAKPLTKRAGRGASKKASDIPAERMAGPSIRISYDSNGEAVCREVACEGLATAVGYCRMHYIKNWKKIKRKDVILKEGKLNQYIEELVSKYPDKYIEAIRQDLANDKDFAKVIYDLDLDESVDDFDAEGESLDSIVGDIKRDFDDDGDSGF